jgi:hypothetical protein
MEYVMLPPQLGSYDMRNLCSDFRAKWVRGQYCAMTEDGVLDNHGAVQSLSGNEKCTA